jgi:hypothetical protein
MPMSIEEALGTLIRMANPYTTGAAGTMQFSGATAGPPPTINPDQIPVEEDRYTAQWVFRGQAETVEKALRVEYQYDATDEQGNLLGYKVTEHLLIGFAGSGGGC